MPTSTPATAGTYATAQKVNEIREDAINATRTYRFEVNGVLQVGDEQGGRFIALSPNETVLAIKHKIKAGTSCTFRVQKDTDDIDNSIVAGTSVAEETSIADPDVVENQVYTMDITEVSGNSEDLLVQVIVGYEKE